jgi:hypothetical protein
MKEILDHPQEGIAVGLIFLSPRFSNIFIKTIYLVDVYRIRSIYPVIIPGLMAYDKAQIKGLLTSYGKIDIFILTSRRRTETICLAVTTRSGGDHADKCRHRNKDCLQTDSGSMGSMLHNGTDWQINRRMILIKRHGDNQYAD